MAASLSGEFNLQEFTDLGVFAVGGRLYTYVPATTTQKVAYTDQAGAVPHTYTSDGIGGQYIALNARGELPAPLFLTSGGYDIAYKTAAGATVWTRRAIGGDDSLLTFSASLLAATGASLVGFSQSSTYGAGTVGRALQGTFSVRDSPYNATGDGATDDTAAFVAAGAGTGGPIFVPYTANFYALTALTTALRARLWGPGEVRVAGVVTTINTQPPTVATTKAMLTVRNDALTPAANTTLGAVGRGSAYFRGLRTGGVGLYGAVTGELRVTASLASGELDVGMTSWANMDGGMVNGSGFFGGWQGANSPNFGAAWTGGGVCGLEVNVGHRSSNDTLITDVGATPYSVVLQVVPDVIPTDNLATWPMTMTVGAPGTVNLTAHKLLAGTSIRFYANGGTLPAAITEGTIYFVSAAGLTANTFRVTATLGGADINFATSSTGAPYSLPSVAANFGILKGPSIWGHRLWIGDITRYDTIQATGFAFQVAGGSSASFNVPAALIKALGFWVNGLDLSGGSFSSTPLKFNAGLGINGYGVPTSVAKTASLPGTASTLAQVGGTLAALIVDLKAIGVIQA